MIPTVRTLPLAALLACAPALSAAQTVQGRLLDPAGKPVDHVLVALLDDAGQQRAAALTDASGAFSIRAPAAGRYALRAERIGYATVRTEAFDLRDGQVRNEQMVASDRAVALQGITVAAGERRCAVRPGAGEQTAALWEEARKALNAAAFGEQAHLFRYDLVRWTRDLDPRTGAVRNDDRHNEQHVATHPFQSAPPDVLSRSGFVVAAEADSTAYWGPDANVLLSNEFLNDHCFRTEAGDDPALVGLAFEPVRGRRVADLRGVMWLDRATAELRRVEFRYVNGPPESREPRVGGSVEYARVPDGRWIVSRWAIRMPVVEEGRGVVSGTGSVSLSPTTMSVVVAVRERGGEVTRTTTADAPALALAPAPSGGVVIEGVVWDSTRAVPLAGADVYLSGTRARAVSGPDGAFRLTAPAAGTYTLGFTHPELGALASAARPVQVEVTGGANAPVRLSVPAWPRVVAALCPDSTLQPYRGVVLGTLKNTPDPQALVVTASWTRAGSTGTREGVAARPDAQGFYVVCGVPEARPLRLSVRAGGAERTTTDALVAAGVPLRRDLEGAEGPVRLASAGAAAAAISAAAGPELFVQRRRGGRGIYLGPAELKGRRFDRVAELLRTVPGVQVVAEGSHETVRMVSAYSSRRARDMVVTASEEDAERRAAAGGGSRSGGSQSGGTGTTTSSRGTRGSCVVQYYVNGALAADEVQVLAGIRPEQVEALEVYRSGTEVPTELRRPGSDCGVVVVWTHGQAQ